MMFVPVAMIASVLMSGVVGNPAPAGSYAVSTGSYKLGGFKCGKQEPTCNIYYPTDLGKGPFPIATFGHGMGGDIIEDLVNSAVSLGMVVVAPATSGGKCDDNHWKDMLHALDGSKAKVSLHKALSHVDWNRTGIFGHSMGGFASLFAGAAAMKEPERYNVKAVLASHGYIGDGNDAASQITVPTMFATGTEDHRGAVKAQFDACPGRPKVLAQVTGAQHMEPMSPGRLNPFDAHFLGCHVIGLKTSCDKINGKRSQDMCQANKMTICDIVALGPGPSPGPAPPPPGPSPAPPAPGPSPSPDVPQKCQQCFKKACAAQQGKSDTCMKCLKQHMGPCAKDCMPTPFKTVEDWFCKSEADTIVV